MLQTSLKKIALPSELKIFFPFTCTFKEMLTATSTREPLQSILNSIDNSME